MLWTSKKNHGFTDEKVNSWLPCFESKEKIDVQSQQNNPYSLWNTYVHLLQLRKSKKALSMGKIKNIILEENILSFCRESTEESVLVAVNFGLKKSLYQIENKSYRILYTTSQELKLNENKNKVEISLPPLSGVIL
jgi:glycosidase